MLDSTGTHIEKTVLCFLCQKMLGFTVYTPQTGHDGQPVDVGGCIERQGLDKNIAGSLFFKIISAMPDTENPAFKNYDLCSSPEPYHNGGYHLPAFGVSFNNVIWVCATCLNHYVVSDVELRSLDAILRGQYLINLETRLGLLVLDLFEASLLKMSDNFQSCLSHLGTVKSNNILKNLDILMSDLKFTRCAPTSRGKEIENKLQPIMSGLVKK